MVKFMILFGLVLFSEIHGIPTTGQIPDDSSATERSRVGGWITFSPSWPLSSILSVSSLFHGTESIENAMKLMKKRIENLEKSQKSSIELLKTITLGAVNSPCNTNESPQSEEPILSSRPEEINKKPRVKPTSPLPPSVTDQMPGEIDSMTLLKDGKAETTVPVGSEKPITSITPESMKYEHSTTPSGNENNREIVGVLNIEIPLNNNQTLSISNTGKKQIEDEKNPTSPVDTKTNIEKIHSGSTNTKEKILKI